MNVSNVHNHPFWNLIVLFLLLAVGYGFVLYLLRNYTLPGGSMRKKRRKQLGGIIYKLIQSAQGKLHMSEREQIDLKVELWKLLRKSSNKRMATSILKEMNLYLDKGGNRIIQKISKEFGLGWEAMENRDAHGSSRVYKTNNYVTKPGSLQKEEPNLNFVPIVTDNGGNDDSCSWELQEEPLFGNHPESSTENRDRESFQINPYKAIHGEIYGRSNKYSYSSPAKAENFLLNIDFLPLIMEMEEGKEAPVTNLYDLEVEYEVVLDPHFKKQVSDILKSHQEKESKTALQGEDNKLLDLGEMKLPPAKFYTDSEFKKVKLLHSIAEMGDMREVPLLNEMLDGEENESIGNLIKEIIFKFLYDCPMDIDKQNTDNRIVDFGEHYVFNHLFNSLDIESQLLLLKEIQQIGDLSDLYFLKTLHDHPNKTIGEKAKLVSQTIEAKFQAILTGETQTFSGHNMDSNNEINDPSKVIKDPWISFEAAKSGFISTIVSGQKSMDTTNRITSLDYSDAPSGKEGGNIGDNDLFHIDFDITSLENMKDYKKDNYKKGKSIADLEEMKFLDHLKFLTNKLFKK
ncbi:MAG: hypothetical protein R2814_00060 [Flavobacteriaceae bacterium]